MSLGNQRTVMDANRHRRLQIMKRITDHVARIRIGTGFCHPDLCLPHLGAGQQIVDSDQIRKIRTQAKALNLFLQLILTARRNNDVAITLFL